MTQRVATAAVMARELAGWEPQTMDRLRLAERSLALVERLLAQAEHRWQGRCVELEATKHHHRPPEEKATETADRERALALAAREVRTLRHLRALARQELSALCPPRSAETFEDGTALWALASVRGGGR